MRQTELHLTDKDRELIESYRVKGFRHAREVNRAHILYALDREIPEAQIMAVLGVGRTAIWRTRSAYLCQSAFNTFHPSVSNCFHFIGLLRTIFALLEAVRIATRFQNIAMMGNAVQ